MFPGDDEIVEKYLKFRDGKGEGNLSYNQGYNSEGYEDNKRKYSGSSVNSNEMYQNKSFNQSFDKIF